MRSLEVAKDIAMSYSSTAWTARGRVTHAETRKTESLEDVRWPSHAGSDKSRRMDPGSFPSTVLCILTDLPLIHILILIERRRWTLDA